MRIAGGPFIEEGMRIYFSERIILRSYLVCAAILGLMLVLWWPRAGLDLALRTGSSTDAFLVVAIGMLFCVMYLSARYGAEGYSPDSMVHLREYVALTPVSVVSATAGKLAFAFLHTLFLLALGVPFLLASLAVSGVGLARALAACAVVGATGLAVRMYGLLLHTLFAGRRLPCNLLLAVGVALYVGLSQALASPASPIMALLSLSPRGMVLLPSARLPAALFAFSSIVNLLAACVLAGGVAARLAGVKARARRTAKNE